MNEKCRFIGEEWEPGKAENYKQIIIDEICNEFSDSVIIGSLLSYLEKDFRRYFDIKNERNLFLIFDVHNFYIYRDDIRTKSARVEDLASYIADVTSKAHLELLKNLSRTKPVKPFFFAESVKLIRELLNHLNPGQAFAVNTKSFEVESLIVSHHPLVKSFAPQTSDRKNNYEINSEYVNGTGRSSDQLSLSISASQTAGLVRMSEMVVNKLSVPGSRSMVAWREGTDKLICGGAHAKPVMSEMISFCESLERFQVMYHPADENLIFSNYPDIASDAVDPRDLFYDTVFRGFDPQIPIYWTEAFDLTEKKKIMVPAQEVWFDNERLAGEKLWIANTTNGCAVGKNREESTLFAILEVIERDCFLTSWYLKRKCKQIIPETIKNDSLHWIIARINYQRPGYKLFFLDLRNDLKVPVVCALAVRESGKGPKFLCAVAARLTYSQASLAAIKDIQNLLAYFPDREEYERVEELIKNKNLIKEPEDHKGLYITDEMFDKVKFFTEGTQCSLEEPARFDLVENEAGTYDLKELIEKIVADCREADTSLIVKDITQNDLRDHELHCVKAIGVGMFPIWYGYGNARINITPRLEKLSELYNNKGIAVKDLNLEIHPFG